MARSYTSRETGGFYSPQIESEMQAAKRRDSERLTLLDEVNTQKNLFNNAMKFGTISQQNKVADDLEKAQGKLSEWDKKNSERIKSEKEAIIDGMKKAGRLEVYSVKEGTGDRVVSGGLLKNITKSGKAIQTSGLISENALGKQYADDDARVFAYEKEGMSRSDAQSAVEAENADRPAIGKADQDDALRTATDTLRALQSMSQPIRFEAMVGAKDVKIFTLPAGSSAVEMKLPTPKWGGKAAVVGIKYNRGTDSYGVYVRSTTGDKGIRFSVPEGVYVDELKRTLEEATGMAFGLR